MAASENTALLPPPAPPGKKYRPFQLETILLARDRRNILIADEMGLGKTVQAIGVINDSPDIRKVLIVCPASLKINWLRELLAWLTRPDATIGLVDTKRGFPSADIVITNYENLKPFHRNIHAVNWDLVVIDEAHYLKNRNANRSKELLGYESDDPMKRRPKLESRRCLMLTGTPIVNRPYELWTLLHHLAPDEFADRAQFIRDFCGGRSGGQRKSEIGEENLRTLHQRLNETVMIRRLKKDVLPELPDKIRQVLVIPADSVRNAIKAEQKGFAEIQRNLSLIRMKAELAKAVDNDEIYREAVAQLRQAEFVTIQQISRLRMQTAMLKIPLVVEHIREVLRHVPKVVVFAHHISVIENLALEFGDAVVTAHGNHPVEERQARVDRFQNDPSCRVFIGSIKAMGVGLTLTAAQVVCFAELDWTPSSLSQAEDRCHRIGQQGSVLVQHLVLDGSLDAMVARKVVQKQETITAALDEDLEVRESLYALSKATPFVPEDRSEVFDLAQQLSPDHIAQVHDTIEKVVARGPRNDVSMLDFNILRLLAAQEYLEPAQAALALLMMRKVHGS